MVDLRGRIVVVDLDDTLYPEQDYACSGFGAVGAWMLAEHGIRDFARHCRDLFDQGARGNVFDLALQAARSTVDIDVLIGVYRAHAPTIVLAPDAERLLARLAGTPCALITDGPTICQQAKVDALGLSERIGKLILTGALPPGCGKPHPLPFEQVELWSGRPSKQHVYVADNPAKDFIEPRRRGWLTVQINRHGRIHPANAPSADHAPDHVIVSLDELVLP